MQFVPGAPSLHRSKERTLPYEGSDGRSSRSGDTIYLKAFERVIQKMGMFDSVHVEIPGCPTSDFQTKALVCTLALYKVREDGSFWYTKDRHSGYDRIYFHGQFRIYTSYNNDTWWEYHLRFTEGFLTLYLPVIVGGPLGAERPDYDNMDWKVWPRSSMRE